MKKAIALVLFLGSTASAAEPTPAATSTPAASTAELQKNDIDMAKLEQALSTKRREVVASGMGGSLTADQMKAFWDVYADFEKEKDAIMSSRIGLLKNYTEKYATLTDADITKMINESAAIQKQTLDLRMKYYDILTKKLGAKAAGRFVHIDDYITTIARIAILDNMPALQASAPPATK